MMMLRRKFLQGLGNTFAATVIGPTIAEGQAYISVEGNPVLPASGLCDPQVRIYGDRAYLYATHDASALSPYYTMHDWWVWRSDDLVSWVQVSTLHPEETYWKKPSNECWATDGISHKGKYYFYFSRGPEEIGVVVGDSAAGPWKDRLGVPLVAKGMIPTEARDPGILQEADGTTYIVFGLDDYYIARLNDDMISFAEAPRKILVDRKMGPYGPGKGDDKPFLHHRGRFYYLSWGCYYAMATDPYGPYVYQDSIIKEENTAPAFRKGLTMDRHGSFFLLHGQWYFICNDQSWPGQGPYFRTAVISYVRYRENGQIATLDLNRLGVGAYDAAQPIPAVNFFKISDGEVRETSRADFEVQGLRDGSWLLYPKVHNLPKRAKMTLRLASAVLEGATLEIHAGSVSGRLLGKGKVLGGADWNAYQDVAFALRGITDTEDLCVVIRGGPGELVRLSSLAFV